MKEIKESMNSREGSKLRLEKMGVEIPTALLGLGAVLPAAQDWGLFFR